MPCLGIGCGFESRFSLQRMANSEEHYPWLDFEAPHAPRRRDLTLRITTRPMSFASYALLSSAIARPRRARERWVLRCAGSYLCNMLQCFAALQQIALYNARSPCKQITKWAAANVATAYKNKRLLELSSSLCVKCTDNAEACIPNLRHSPLLPP